MNVEDDRCQWCKSWDIADEPDPDEEKLSLNHRGGDCRRYPPIFPTIIPPKRERWRHDWRSARGQQGEWPVVRGDDWCGEFAGIDQ